MPKDFMSSHRLVSVVSLLAVLQACASSSSSGREPTASGGQVASGASSGGASATQGGAGTSTRPSEGGALGGAQLGGASSGGRETASSMNGGRAGMGSGGSNQASGSGGGGASSCINPVFTTSDHNGGFSDGGYYVHNNMWNSEVSLGPETLYACSYRSWYVVSKQTNEQGAVKTYPNVHKDYDDVPIASFERITSSFAATSPHVGIYNVAYDIWTNGVATSGSTEFMIWTENFNQVPAGDQVASATFGERVYDVWRTSNGHYIALVPEQPFTSGRIDLLEILQWATKRGWLRDDSTLGQIGFGVEIVSTEGKEAVFEFSDFTIQDAGLAP
ncbi:MAG TPA: hypothetical protein VFQ61_36275 [Polyangiaceae bacterium]|nr:hypothetical protein [Polyangiaceae bacterium]